MIISYVQTKGGTGKSTLAAGTAFSRALKQSFDSIALVELDPQGTLRNWWNEREEMKRNAAKVSFHHISSTQKEVFHQSIKTIAAHNQCIVMDIPGESTGRLHTRFACASSDLVIIPMRTSTHDESAFADNLFPTIREIINFAPERKGRFYVLPAFVHPRSNPLKIIDYFEDILPTEIKCLHAVFPNRTIYENFNRDGMHMTEYLHVAKNNKRLRQQAQRAVDDMEQIVRAILERN